MILYFLLYLSHLASTFLTIECQIQTATSSMISTAPLSAMPSTTPIFVSVMMPLLIPTIPPIRSTVRPINAQRAISLAKSGTYYDPHPFKQFESDYSAGYVCLPIRNECCSRYHINYRMRFLDYDHFFWWKSVLCLLQMWVPAFLTFTCLSAYSSSLIYHTMWSRYTCTCFQTLIGYNSMRAHLFHGSNWPSTIYSIQRLLI